MNFWHMQLHPNNPSWGLEKEVIEQTGYIGLGDWKEKRKAQQISFQNDMRIGDIVAIKRGEKLIALVRVKGDYEYKSETNKSFDWFERRRQVEILDWYRTEYDLKIVGRKTLTRCDMTNSGAETNINIKKWYKKVMSERQINEVVDLLKYKHQVILQGPPGTGKTRLAKLIAGKLTQSENKGNPEQIIDNLIINFDTESDGAKIERENIELILSVFHQKFPKERLKELTLDSYSIGTGNNDSFCWWIERGLEDLGYYFPGSSRSYKIYWSKPKDKYSKHGFVKDVEDDVLAMAMVAETLHDLVNNGATELAFERFGNSFVLKVLQSYYPDEYFPINSEKAIENVLKLFDSFDNSLNLLEQNRKLSQIYLDKKNQHNSKITKNEFAKIIWSNFNLKSGEELTQNKEVVTRGKSEIVQFHPGYTYEDFVRGIVASSHDGVISYEVENKILAEFAKKAIDNPNGKYVLIIDEINRANLPSVLGELIYALEYRGETVQSIYEYEDTRDIKLPKNLYIIGTMNTADRSVGHIDYAIRRRFAFYDVLPSKEAIVSEKARTLFERVSELFDSSSYLSSDFDANDVRIGHSYFIPSDKETTEDEFDVELRQKLKYEIKPILYEYIKDGILLDSAKEVVKNLHV
ncbi:AAA family ATPase [uncultured Psychrobacter sp.]|uniref:McrB family protein n=1 Tax=uncultured Psychrobacter sp. TaxID=259303 RepID=UPI003459B86C